MKIVLLESLGVGDETLKRHIKKIKSMGHEFISYEKNTDTAIQTERIKDADAVILANMPLASLAIEGAKNLKFIDVAFTGVDHIPMDNIRKRKIAVSNASGYATEAVAELCISFMIQLLRNVKKTEESCRSGGTKDGLVGNLLFGKTVGIVGAGKIGKKLAGLLKAFDCTVLAYNRSSVLDAAIDRQVTLKELLKASDIVSLHCPLTEDTKGLIGKEQLAVMKKSAVLINTARGAIVDQEALVHALSDGIIAGCACDVFESEPPLSLDNPLLSAPNTILTPHIAFASQESMEERAKIVFENLYSWLDGNQINIVS